MNTDRVFYDVLTEKVHFQHTANLMKALNKENVNYTSQVSI